MTLEKMRARRAEVMESESIFAGNGRIHIASATCFQSRRQWPGEIGRDPNPPGIQTDLKVGCTTGYNVLLSTKPRNPRSET